MSETILELLHGRRPSLHEAVERRVGEPWAPPERDCWAFVATIYAEVYGITLARPGHDAQELESCLSACYAEARSGDWIRVPVPAAGDVVLMGRRHYPHHCGIWVPGCPDRIAHCLAPAGVSLPTLASLRSGWPCIEYLRHRSRP